MSYFDLRDNVLDYDSQDCLGCLAVSSQDTQIYDLYLSDASFVISLESSSLTFKSKFGKSTPALFIFFTSLSIFSLLSTPHRKLHICWLEMYSRGRTLTLWFQCHKTKLHVCFAGFFFLFVCISSQRANPSILFLTLTLNPALQMTFNTQ